MMVPDALKVGLKWTDSMVLTNIAGFGKQSWVMNDPHSNQPLYWDQWKTLYNKYYCVASKFKVRFLPNDSVEAIATAWPHQRDVSEFNDTQEVKQQRYATSIIVNGRSMPSRVITKTTSIAKIDGFRPTGINYIASTSASPNEARYWNLAIESLSVEDISEIYLSIEITFYVRFFQPARVAVS